MPPNKPLVPTALAASLRSTARPAAQRPIVRRHTLCQDGRARQMASSSPQVASGRGPLARRAARIGSVGFAEPRLGLPGEPLEVDLASALR